MMSNPEIHAYAATEKGGKLNEYSYDPGELKTGDVEIEVSHCGICHSDLSMLKNDWGMTEFPLVPGHEVAGKISAIGEGVSNLSIGQRVGLGWQAHACGQCEWCLKGDQNLCPESIGTITGRHGGFADRVRAQATMVIPLPDGIATENAGPLFCGGATVFNPFIQNEISPLARVGVVGIGGLGHMALAFANAWGCEVTAFSTSPDKEDEAKKLGAHHFINVKEAGSLEKVEGSFDMILVTVNVPLDWDLYIAALRQRGKLHIVGAVPEVKATFFPLLAGQRSVGGSPIASPAHIADMLRFAERHGVTPVIETFAMADVNDALQHLESGDARYRIVLAR
jgi:uncharacterized zinc-type alcohol dehydrogenase-like protein